MSTRTQKAKLNILSSFLSQITTLICGFIVPRLLIKTFGSEVYGATTSIANFLAYISLIEGGVAGVARAALYTPLATGNNEGIRKVYTEIKKFFNTIGIVFLVYSLVIASTYNVLAKETHFEWLFSFLLVISISISTLGQYFFGISNSVLLQADQKLYINNILSVFTVIINTVSILILTNINCNIIMIKMVSSIIFLVRPLFLSLYVKKHYSIDTSTNSNSDQSSTLGQKWTALGQHIAYFLHSNTDIAVLTILSDLKTVAVYSVYYMIVTGIRNLSSSIYNGLEAVLGELYAKKENEKLQQVFGYYDTLISVTAVILFSCASSLIIPFIRLYTRGVNDTNYILPQFGFILIAAELVYTLRIPYHYMINASSRFKQTRVAAYGEATINIILSVLLVFKFGILGVAIATLVATMFRGLYYAVYLSKHVMHRNIQLFIKRTVINAVLFFGVSMLGYYFISKIEIRSYLQWGIIGVFTCIFSTLIIIFTNFCFYYIDMKEISKRIIRIVRR